MQNSVKNNMNENDLLNKLAISKKIMDIHNGTPRSQNNLDYNGDSSVQQFNAPRAKYNIPQEFMNESVNTKPIPQYTNSSDKILNSKLPDEIKKLMMEHPIEQPKTMGGSSVLSK